MYRLILFLLLFTACKQKPLVHAVYYWKMGHEEDTGIQTKMQELGVDHLYIHLFDVDWDRLNRKAVPRSVTHATGFRSLKDLDYTPVIFITNAVFENSTLGDCDTLAQRVYQKTIEIKKTRLPQSGFDELQIDCDWTASTKERYFTFLSALKKQLGTKQLSVTIRLYPYKYPEKMGVPPADKGVLMCYNLGAIKSPQTRNAIFDKKQLDLYLTKKKYTLPLDIALPVFGWYVWSRNTHYKGIIYESPELVEKEGFEPVNVNNFRVTTDTVIQGQYLRAGDLLRKEYPDEAELTASAKELLSGKLVHERIIFYHWDSLLIQKYEHVIKEVYSLR